MTYDKAVEKLYNYFYNKIYRTSFKLDLSINNQKKIVDNFVNLIAKQLQLPDVPVNYLIEYFCYSFHYHSTKETKRRISLNWIIGKKTFARWLERKDGVEYYTDKWILEHGLDLDRLRQELFEQETEDRALDVSEEIEKLRFDDLDARLFNCVKNTTMYNHRSLNCLSCKNKIVCKSMLKSLSPQLYRKRGY